LTEGKVGWSFVAWDVGSTNEQKSVLSTRLGRLHSYGHVGAGKTNVIGFKKKERAINLNSDKNSLLGEKSADKD